MNLKERIKTLCKENGITVNKLEKTLGFGTGYVAKLDNSTPNTAKIKLIADFFNVSLDYLMNGKEPEYSIEVAKIDVELSNMNDRLKEYALKLSNLPKDKQEHVMQIIDWLQ